MWDLLFSPWSALRFGAGDWRVIGLLRKLNMRGRLLG